MRILFVCFAALALTLGLGCSGPEVHYDYDSKVSYSSFHSYDWYATPAAAKTWAGAAGNPIMDARVRRAVEAELAAKHFHKEAGADPDFLVTYYPVYHRRPGAHTFVGLGFAGPGLGVGVAGPVSSGPRGQVGSIVLEIKDFKSHQMIWKAQAEDVLDDTGTPEDSDQDVAAAVKKMLMRFPPTVSAS